MEYLYAKNIESDEPIMLLNKHIGMDVEDGMGVDGSLFQEELLALDQMGKKRIQVWINSVGGVVMDGYNICNAILKSRTRVDTYCLGMAASIAGVIFQTGRKRFMADYGILMYHNPYAGKTTESPLLDSMKDSLNCIISQRSGMNVDAVHRMMDRTSFIQASEAYNLGLCDEVETTVQLNTKNFPREANGYYREANKVINKIFDNNNNLKKMVKVTSRLKLNPDATEDSIVRAIDLVVNKATADAAAKSKEDLDKMKADLDDADAKFKQMKAAYDAAIAEAANANNKVIKIEDEVKEEKAKAMVSEYVRIGKVFNNAAVITAWTARAKADMVETKRLLESIPTNKAAAKFNYQNSDKKEPVYNAAVELAKISARMDQK